MNPQEAKEFVRRKCIEANPDILKLELGCRVKKEFGGDTEHVWRVISTRKYEVELQYFHDIHCTFTYLLSELGEHTIIGRDIRLADVLLSLKGRNYLIDDLGVFWKFTKGGNPHYEVDYHAAKCSWNLLDDSLDNQSPETWVALAEMMR